MIENLIPYIEERRSEFKGNPKDLDELLEKVASVWHAPTSTKHTERMVPYAKIPEVVTFINDTLKPYFVARRCFDDSELTFGYDIRESWYLFTLLVCSAKVEDTVDFMIDSLIEQKIPSLSIARRILNLCANPVYHKQQEKVEQYFTALTSEVEAYVWAEKIGLELPNTHDWEFYFTLYGELKENHPEVVSDHIIVSIRVNAPDGAGTSYDIQLRDRASVFHGWWQDHSDYLKIMAKNKLYELNTKPSLFNLKAFIKELEDLFNFDIQKEISSSYFSRGIKKKNAVQKWLLE